MCLARNHGLNCCCVSLQGLQNSASTFAGMVSMFAERLNWTSLSLIMAHFAERVNFGVQSELLQLIEIPEVQASA